MTTHHDLRRDTIALEKYWIFWLHVKSRAIYFVYGRGVLVLSCGVAGDTCW